MFKDRILCKDSILSKGIRSPGRARKDGECTSRSCSCAGQEVGSDANSDEPHGALRHSGLCASEKSGPSHWGQRASHPQAAARTEVLLHSCCPQLSTGTFSACNGSCHAHCSPGLMGEGSCGTSKGSMKETIPHA